LGTSLSELGNRTVRNQKRDCDGKKAGLRIAISAPNVFYLAIKFIRDLLQALTEALNVTFPLLLFGLAPIELHLRVIFVVESLPDGALELMHDRSDLLHLRICTLIEKALQVFRPIAHAGFESLKKRRFNPRPNLSKSILDKFRSILIRSRGICSFSLAKIHPAKATLFDCTASQD
jgi:hypothetical protein